MSVFTWLSETQLERFLSAYGCGKFVRVSGIVEGITNSNFNLTTTSAEYILTIYEHTDASELVDILALQQHLNQAGIACAKVINTNNGVLFDTLADKPAAILEKLPGSTTYSVTSNLCRQVGETLAKLHLTGKDYPFSRTNPRGAGWISTISSKIMEHLSKQDQLILHQELEYLSRFSRLSLPSGTLHANLVPHNVLTFDDHISAILDFKLACHDVFLFDLGICINAWCSQKDGQLDRFLMRDLLSAYSSLKPLNQDENIAIPMMLRATALSLWLSSLQDKQFCVDRGITFNKDPDEFKTKLLARRQRLSGMQR